MKGRIVAVWRTLIVKVTGGTTPSGGFVLQSDAASKIVLTDGASFLVRADG